MPRYRTRDKYRLAGVFAPANDKQRAMIMHFIRGIEHVEFDTIRILCPPNVTKPNEIAVFFGVSPSTHRSWKAHRGEYVYIDNCYLGKRGDYFRVTRNALMASSLESQPGELSNGKRFRDLGIRFRPWRREGRHILLCLQSPLYYDLLMGVDRKDWIAEVCRTIRKYSDRPIILREKPNFRDDITPLVGQLESCHAVVTWNSTAALQAISAGVPAFCLDPNNSFRSVCPSNLKTIEDPRRGARRLELFHWLADNQWSKDEIESGQCWTTLRNQC